MTPQELINAASQIHQRWPDALIYVNPAPAANEYVRNPGVPPGALAVDVDRIWPDNDDPPDEQFGEYRLVAWINTFDGEVHWVGPTLKILGAS